MALQRKNISCLQESRLKVAIANCTVLRAVVLTQYRHVTDGRTDRQTDGIAVASTAFAMRTTALCKKSLFNSIIHTYFRLFNIRKQTVTPLPTTPEKCYHTTL